MTSVLTRLTKQAACGLLLLGVMSCGTPESAVRPLVSIPEEKMGLAKYDDKSVQERLDRLVVDLAKIAETSKGWGNLTTDIVNPLVANLTFIGSSRATSAYGSGTETTSMLSADNYSIFAMASDVTGNCWAIKITDGARKPQVARTTLFAPQCKADVHTGEASGVWRAIWPKAAEPVGTSPSTTLP